MLFQTYAVSFDDVKAAVGSKDAKLLAAIKRSQKLALKDDAADRDEGDWPLEDGLADLIAGKLGRKKEGLVYCEAFRLLCAHLGSSPIKFDLSPSWVAEFLDDLLGGDIMKILGFYSKYVVALPDWDGLPELTTLTGAACEKLSPRFAKANAAAKTTDQRKALTELGKWLSAGARAGGLAIFIV